MKSKDAAGSRSRRTWVQVYNPLMRSTAEPTLFRPGDVLARSGGQSFQQPLFDDGRNEVSLLCDAPASASGRGAVVYDDSNAFWFVLRGEYEWRIGGLPPMRAAQGDIVMAPAGIPHAARLAGEEPGLRIAVSKRGGERRQADPGEAKTPTQRTCPPNMLITRTADLLTASDQRRFTIVEDDRNTLFLIREYPGAVSSAHWHFDFDEWWVIGGGELVFEIGEGRPRLHARTGDVVFAPRGFRHRITTIGARPSLRMPVTTADNIHIWTDADAGAPAPRA